MKEIYDYLLSASGVPVDFIIEDNRPQPRACTLADSKNFKSLLILIPFDKKYRLWTRSLQIKL